MAMDLEYSCKLLINKMLMFFRIVQISRKTFLKQ